MGRQILLKKRDFFHDLQLRLDFNNFVITGPNTLTDAVANRKEMSGVVAPGGGVAVNRFTQCSTDTFSVSNPDGPNPPAICGTNSNEHSEFFMTVLLKTF